jgi:uncharacterized protein YbaP (TraB family)
MLRQGVRSVLLLSAALWSGCATPASGPSCAIRVIPGPAAPLLWRAQAADDRSGVIYLFGSVHVGSDRAPEYSAEIEAAYARSDELVVELDVTGDSGLQLENRVAARALLDPPDKLQDVLTPQTLALLIAYLEQRGFPIAAIEGMKPWYVTNLLVALEIQTAGYDPEFGVDRHFLQRSAGSIPVVALETAEQQIDLFDSLPLAIQDVMLRDALDRSAQFSAATDEMMEAWQRGDERLLEALVFQPVEQNSDFEGFYEGVFFQRNEAMSERLRVLARDGKTRFVVVGTGHLLGSRGIPALLCADGFHVERVSGGNSSANRW